MDINDSLQKRLDGIQARYRELGELLVKPEIIKNQNHFRDYSKEFAELEPIVQTWQQLQATLQDITHAKELSNDPEMAELAEEEIKALKAHGEELWGTLQGLLIPEDPNDKRNIFLEIRAGAGGSEAAIFVGDLFRMYSRYAENKRWQTEIVSQSSAEQGGYKEIIVRVMGRSVYARLKFESGAHRVQRVPATEAQGRIHTSTCTVAVLPEVEEIEEIAIDPSDLRIDTYRASGAGGQHVNKTDSAIRITHIPSGLVVECQDERSQHKNRAKAMSLLQARLLNMERTKQIQEQAAQRKSLVGSGDRSERIRTYNYPQGRVTDHRINLTLYKLEEIMEGALDHVIEPLVREHHAEQLAAMGNH